LKLMNPVESEKGPNCYQGLCCFVTYKTAHPCVCNSMNFKPGCPSEAVFPLTSSGVICQLYTPKPMKK